MKRFQWCVEQVITDEGGMTNDPDDPGGLTKWGISHSAYPLLDIANLTKDGAIVIYRRDYWEAARCDVLFAPLDYYVFDSAVNQGVGRAIVMLQIALGVNPDGMFGPVTLSAVHNSARGELAALFMAIRAQHYVSLPTYWKFGKGWFKRLFLVAGRT